MQWAYRHTLLLSILPTSIQCRSSDDACISQPRPSGGAAQGPRPWCRRAGRPNDRSSDFKTPARVEVRGGTCRNPARQVHALNACHRLATVDGPTKSKPHASLMRMMMINDKSNAPPTDLVMMMMPSNISSPRYLPVLVVSLCVVCTCARLLCGIP